MPLEKTEAILLRSHNWAESSRTVVVFSRAFGKLALVDKGGRSMKSRRGRLVAFARLQLTFYTSRREGHGYISDLDLIGSGDFAAEGNLGRLAFGSAACELLDTLLPDAEAMPELYDYFALYLDYLNLADRRSLAALFVAFMLRTLSHLGYHPSLAACVNCGRDLSAPGPASEGPAAGECPVDFSVARGGVVCGACQTVGDYYIHLSRDQHGRLIRLQTASLKEAAALPISYREASVLLEVLTRFLSYQAQINGALKSQDFLEKLRRTTLSEQQ